MTKSEFIRILRDPSLMSKEHTFDLEDVVSDFPFFQAARVLYLKGLKSQNSFRYNQSLKTTAVYTNERSVLFAFISSNDYNLPSQLRNEQQIINDIVLHDQKVLDQIYKKENEDAITEENEAEMHSKLEELFGANQIISPEKTNKVQTEEEIFQELFHNEPKETVESDLELPEIEQTSDFFKQPISNPFSNTETSDEIEQTFNDKAAETTPDSFDFKFTPESDVTSKSKLSFDKIQEEEAIFFELFHQKETPQPEEDTSEDDSDYFKDQISHRFPGEETFASELEEKAIQHDNFFASEHKTSENTPLTDAKIKDEEAIFFELFHKKETVQPEEDPNEIDSEYLKENISHRFPGEEPIVSELEEKVVQNETIFTSDHSNTTSNPLSNDKIKDEEAIFFELFHKNPEIDKETEPVPEFFKEHSGHTFPINEPENDSEIDEIAEAFLHKLEAENQIDFVEETRHHKSIFSEDTDSKPEVFKDPFFPSHEEQQEHFLKSQTTHSEIGNVKDIFNIDVTKEIVSGDIDEIADAFLKQFEAENTPEKVPLEKPYEDFDSILQSEYSQPEEVKDAEDLKIPVFLSYDEKEVSEVSEVPVVQEAIEVPVQEQEIANEPELEITEEPVFNIATKEESNVDKVENKVDYEPKDEYTFELLPKEIFEETILEEPIIEKLEVSMSEEFCPPVQFNQNDTHSFSDWLKISTFKPIDRNTEPLKKASLEEKLDLIEEFIVKNPKIEPIKEKKNEATSNPQITENEEIMTETLARVYVLQHKYADAISAYQILSLKFPEKSSFFADQIKQIEVLRRNNL
jgi:hypothetical protein